MRWFTRDEQGQAVVEMALVLMAVLTLCVGLLDVGRGIYTFNSVSAIARYGARWAGVVGGTCSSALGASSSDWCNSLGGGAGNFWAQNGNKPIQGAGAECPNYSTTPADWYTVSNFSGTSNTSIVGAVAKHFDTSSGTSNTIVGGLAPGIDLTKLHICIELSGVTPPATGDSVTVRVNYPFVPATPLISNATVDLNAQSQWQVE